MKNKWKKNSKGLVGLALVIVLLSGCYKVPTTYVGDDKLVITLHDKKGDFTLLKTFAISDTIGTISDDTKDDYVAGPGAKSVVDNIVANFTERGFTRVSKVQVPDFAVNVMAIKILNVESYYPGYWYGYGGYYGGGYWGYPGYGYYYPWSYTYTYQTGSLFLEVVDLKHRDTTGNKLTVIWHCLINGYVDSGTEPATVNRYVDKGFIQSPYIKAN